MSGATATFRAAPLDGVARFITRGMWLLAAGLAVGGLVLSTQGGGPAGGWLLVSAVLLGALVLVLRRLRPVEYVLEDGGFTVRRRGASPKRFAGSSGRAQRGRLGHRVAGDGGVYGYLGRYRADGRTVHTFVTDRDRVVLLEVGDAPLAVSPDDPETFLEEVARGA